jgi:peptidoglycan/LPS O-acetylase OafA/YrhL
MGKINPYCRTDRPPGGANRTLLPALTGLRFFLAVWVILQHITSPGGMLEAQTASLPAALRSLVLSGYQAVTTFFVLSGFVLMRNYESSEWTRSNLRRYAVARFARIYPIYALSLIAVTPFIIEAWQPSQARLLAAHILMLQAWIWPLPVNWNTPAWSLSCEMFFYLLFPLGVLLLRGARWPRVLVAATIAICLTRVLWRLGVSDDVKPLVHLADFLMGLAAARAYDLLSKSSSPPPAAALYLPAFALAALVLAFPETIPLGLDANTVLRPLNALVLVGLALGGGWIARALSTAPAVYLGKASYATYILHVPILWWYARLVKTQSAIVYICAVIVLSSLVYSFVEEPANGYLRRRFQRAL